MTTSRWRYWALPLIFPARVCARPAGATMSCRIDVPQIARGLIDRVLFGRREGSVDAHPVERLENGFAEQFVTVHQLPGTSSAGATIVYEISASRS